MRTCQPHLSISWNFPPPLSSLIYSISFGHTQPTSQWSLYKITAADTNRPARDPVGATLLQPDCTRFQGVCSGWETITTPYQTLIAPKFLSILTRHLTPEWGQTPHLLWKLPVECTFMGAKVLFTADHRSGEPQINAKEKELKPHPAKWMHAAASFQGLKAKI